MLLAFGLRAIYFSLDGAKTEKNMFMVTVVGLLAAIAGGWILLTRLTLGLILVKFAGLVLLGIGLFLIFGFPDSKDYQKFGMSTTGIFIGLILAIIGGWILFF